MTSPLDRVSYAGLLWLRQPRDWWTGDNSPVKRQCSDYKLKVEGKGKGIPTPELLVGRAQPVGELYSLTIYTTFQYRAQNDQEKARAYETSHLLT